MVVHVANRSKNVCLSFKVVALTHPHNNVCMNAGPWNARSATVLGQRGAWIFSTEQAVHNAITATTAGVSVSRISNGDVLDLSSYQITPAGDFFYLVILFILQNMYACLFTFVCTFHSLTLCTSSSSFSVFYPAYKSALVQSATAAATSSDIFGEEVFELDRIALSLLQSSVSAVTEGTTRQSNPKV